MIPTRQLVLALAVCSITGNLAAQPARSTRNPLDGLDRYITATMPDWGVPGVAIAIVKDDRVVYSRGFGVRRLGDTARVTPETMFAIGSISKSFTAASVGILVDEGKVAWNDPVIRRMPSFAMSTPEATASTSIEDLLSHRTGLAGENVVFWGSDVPRAEVVRRIRFLPLANPARTTFDYQNLAFVAAGEVVAAVTGTSWDDVVERRIFRPLGMTRSTTRVSELGNFRNVATSHAPRNGKLAPIPFLNLDNAAPAGSIVSSVNDMARYVRMQLGRGKLEGTRVLSDSTIRQLHTGRTIVPLGSALGPAFPDAHFIEYGLGWFLQDYHGYQIVTHGGQTDGQHANLLLAPELGLGVVVLTNTLQFGYPIAITLRVLDSYLGRAARDWSKEMRVRLAAFNESPPPLPAEIAGRSAKIAASTLVGRYRDDYLGDAVVSQEGQQLSLAMLGRTATLTHWRDEQYAVHWDDPLLLGSIPTATFESAGNGASLRIGRWVMRPQP
jgi:CubicO group peptidase (beta-lactamase class C family)